MHTMPPPSIRGCPACGAKITVRTRGSPKKLQCPKCLQIIPVAPALPPPAGLPQELEEITRDLAALSVEVRRVAAEVEDQKRVTRALERELSVLGSSAQAEPPVALPGIAPAMGPDGVGRRLNERQHTALVEALRTGGSCAVSVRCPLDDEEAARFAGELRAAYMEAGWRAGEPVRCEFDPRRRGLVIAAGELPAPVEVVRTFKAFAGAGLKAATCLDLDQLQEKVVLWVGPREV